MILILVQFNVIDGPKGSTLACSQGGHISTKTTPNIQKLNVRNICYRYIKKKQNNKSQSVKRWGSKCKLSRISAQETKEVFLLLQFYLTL